MSVKKFVRVNSLKYRENLRNVAIIAHVDHGKTTLVDHIRVSKIKLLFGFVRHYHNAVTGR